MNTIEDFIAQDAYPTSPFTSIIEGLNTDSTDPKMLSQEELEAYRLQLALIKRIVGVKMSETGTKEHSYDRDAIVDYIDAILEDGFNLQETELSDYPEFIDAQRLKRWSDLIAERVELSVFGSKQFKVHSLRLLRSNIAKAKTLHELRQAVTLMISPLELWREHLVLLQATSSKQVREDNKENDKYIDSLLMELEQKDKLLVERKRVIDSMLHVYKECDEDISLLRNCENAKKQHNLSDTQAAEMFGISRKKLLRLRADIHLDILPDVDTNPVESSLDAFYSC